MHTQMVQARRAQAQRNAVVSWAANQTTNQRKARIWTVFPVLCVDLTELGSEEEVSLVVGAFNTE